MKFNEKEKTNVKEERFNISPEQEIYIDAKVSNINIYGIYEDIARISYSDNFVIDYGNNSTHIYESLQEPKSDRTIIMNGSNIICTGTSNIVIGNGNVTIVNGQIINNTNMHIIYLNFFIKPPINLTF